MRIGMIGLGRMGLNMGIRLLRAGHDVVGFDLDAAAVTRLEDAGGVGAESIEAMVDSLATPRAIWMMVPAGDVVDATIRVLMEALEPGDVIVDGGNSYYRDTMQRASHVMSAGFQYVDVGTSGGVWGLDEGYSLMIGGEAAAVEHLRPIFESLAPGRDEGWGHVGPSGAGHFVKMVHNGIEYGAMQAYAEGFHIMQARDDLGLNLPQIAEIWRRGSVVRSWLLDLTAAALREDASLARIAPWVSDSGEGRWTVKEAIDLDVPAPVITEALYARFQSRAEDSFAHKLLAAMRNQFGGHAVREADPSD